MTVIYLEDLSGFRDLLNLKQPANRRASPTAQESGNFHQTATISKFYSCSAMMTGLVRPAFSVASQRQIRPSALPSKSTPLLNFKLNSKRITRHGNQSVGPCPHCSKHVLPTCPSHAYLLIGILALVVEEGDSYAGHLSAVSSTLINRWNETSVKSNHSALTRPTSCTGSDIRGVR